MKYVGSKYQKEFMADLKRVHKAATKAAVEVALVSWKKNGKRDTLWSLTPGRITGLRLSSGFPLFLMIDLMDA